MLLKQGEGGPLEEVEHECEGIWLESIQAMLLMNTNESWTDKHCIVMRKLVVEGRCREDCMTLAGRTKRGVKDMVLKKARRNTECSTVHPGGRFEARSLSGKGNGNNGQTRRRRIGNGTKASRRTWSGSNWRKSHLSVRKWESGQWKVLVTMPPPMAPCREVECMWVASGAAES